jgi:SWI/SNF-related matrix-associated actin-dependent regulator 1 of chromatin subfamily A
VSLTGDTPMIDRQLAVDAFQTDPNTRFFIGNIQAAGVGITLTASSHVVLAEIDWVPANMSQAVD